MVFNFDNADIELVVQAASDIVGFNYIIAPAARGRKVTIQTPARIPSDEVFAVLTTVLDVNGLAAVRSGGLYRIIPREGTPQTSVKTVVGREVNDGIPTDEVISQIVPLQFVNAPDMAALVRPFVPPTGTVSAHRETNMLIITDAASNVRRLLEVIKLTDVQVALDEIKIIPLKFADSQEIAQLLAQIFSAPGRVRAPGPAGAPPVAPPAPAGAPGIARTTITGAEGATADRPPLIVAERRSNSLVVHARKAEMETIRRLIEQLDLDIYGGQRVFIYFAENAKARDLATTLDSIYGTGGGPAVTGLPPTTAPGTVQQPGRSGLPGTLPTTGTTTTSYGRSGRQAAVGLPGAGEEGPPPGVEVRFIADETTNAVIVTTYPRAWKDIEDTIKKLDRMPRQVLIEVLAAEVTLDDNFNLGMAWAFRRGRTAVTFNPFGGEVTLPLPPPVTAALPPGLNAFIFASDEFLAALNALASDNKVNVVSSPAVMTSENKKAVINVSRSVPIVTSQNVPISGTGDTGGITGTQSVEYRDAGIILTVTPRIGEGGTVALEVKQEFNEVGPIQTPPGSPTFLKREADTSVVLLNNQTLVLGGLIQTRREVEKTGIPLLMNIPVLGYLFGATKETTRKTELLILITPRVVGNAADANRVTEEFRRSIPALEEPIRQAPRSPLPPK